MKFFVIGFLLVCLSAVVKGQDYVVTNKGDTLRGKVKPLSYEKLDRVEITRDKKKSIFTALQVRMYSYKGQSYFPFQHDNAIQFMKLLKPGYLSLYAFRSGGQTVFDGQFLAKRDGSHIEVPNLNFKKSMMAFLTDCQSVRLKIEDGTYGKSKLNEIIDEYNAYIDKNTLELQKAREVQVMIDQKLPSLEALKTAVQGLPDFAEKKDTEDLLNDMINNLKIGKGVPNYQIDVLKGFLKDNAAVKEPLDKALKEFKTN